MGLMMMSFLAEEKFYVLAFPIHLTWHDTTISYFGWPTTKKSVHCMFLKFTIIVTLFPSSRNETCNLSFPSLTLLAWKKMFFFFGFPGNVRILLFLSGGCGIYYVKVKLSHVPKTFTFSLSSILCLDYAFAAAKRGMQHNGPNLKLLSIQTAKINASNHERINGFPIKRTEDQRTSNDIWKVWKIAIISFYLLDCLNVCNLYSMPCVISTQLITVLNYSNHGHGYCRLQTKNSSALLFFCRLMLTHAVQKDNIHI